MELGNVLFETYVGRVLSSVIHSSNSFHRVTVLDVVKTSGRQNPMVLLQPSPRLQDVFPSMDLSNTAKLNHQLPNLDSAYVGILEETGSLFVMSSDRFPLVAFGDANPSSMYPLIDPPSGTSLPTGAILKPGVDEITKARKLRELCDKGVFDPRCLTGIRKLESSSRSRLSRLLDAAPVAQTPQPATKTYPTPSGIEGPGDNRSLVNVRPPWPHGQAPGQHLQSNLPLWLLVLLSSILGWIVIGRRRWKSVQPQIPVQSFGVDREAELKHVEQTPLIDTITPELPLDRFESPDLIVDDGAPLQEPVRAEEAGESEREDQIATPVRKKPLRRRRGKKKKGSNLAAPADNDEPEGETETDVAVDVAEEGSGKIQLIVPTPATAAAPSSTLVVSDEILGMLGVMYSTLFPDHSSRFRFPRNCGFQGFFTGPCRRCQTSPPGLCHIGYPRGQHPRGIRRPSQRHPVLLPRGSVEFSLHRH